MGHLETTSGAIAERVRDRALELPDIPRERLEKQFVPTDPALWEIDAYQDFLQRRRELLADGINRVLTPVA